MMAHVRLGRWAAYRTRYLWRPVFEGLPAPARLERVEFVDGERDALVLPLGASDARPMPRFFIFGPPQTRERYRPQFDEEEITAAFARAGARGRPVELVFAAPAGEGTSDPRVLVRSAADTVALQHVTYVR